MNNNYMNNLENRQILSDEILAAMDLIIKTVPDAIFGGSIALNAVGLITRKISDIDLFFGEWVSLAKNGILNTGISTGLTSDTVTNTNGKPIQRTGIKINNVHVCIFKVEKLELQHSIFEFAGRRIKIQNINVAIQAKIAYSEKNQKHLNDLNKINDTMHELFLYED
jgi:hypothetical protein